MGKPDIYIVEVRRKDDDSFIGYLKYHKNRSRHFVYDEYLGLRVGVSYTLAKIVGKNGCRRCIGMVEREYRKKFRFHAVPLTVHQEEFLTLKQKRDLRYDPHRN